MRIRPDVVLGSPVHRLNPSVETMGKVGTLGHPGRYIVANDPEKIEEFLQQVLEIIEPWYTQLDRASSIHDQAAAAVRNQMQEYGLDYTDPVVIGSWLAAATYFPMALFLTDGDLQDAVRLCLVTGLMGRVD